MCPYSGLFWSAFSRIRTRITPKTDTFYAVNLTYRTFSECKNLSFTPMSNHTYFPRILL